MKENFKTFETFNIPVASVQDVNKIIKSLNPNKATGPERIPPKIVNLSANIIDSHLPNIINNDLNKHCHSEEGASQ